MSKSFKKQRQFNEYDEEGYYDKRRTKDFKNRRREKQLKNDLRSFRNVSVKDLQNYHEED